jgi:hypothetical protein
MDSHYKNQFDRRLLTEQEVSRIYSVSLPFLRKKRLGKDGPPYLKIGRMVRYRVSDLETYFNDRLVPTQTPDIGERGSRRCNAK